jgi:hypothetical protein
MPKRIGGSGRTPKSVFPGGATLIDQLSMRSPTGGKKVPDEAAMALLARQSTGTPTLSADDEAALDQARAEHMADYQAIVASRFPDWRAWVLEKRCE